MRPLFSFLFFFAMTLLFGQNAYPVMSNLSVQIDPTDEIVTINYDLADPDDTDLKITFLVSDNNGQSFTIPTENATGDVGFPIQPGVDKNITWDATGRLTGATDYQVKLVADDLFQLDIQAIVDQVDSNRLHSNLEFIASPRHRFTSPNHLGAVKDSIEQAFLAADLDTWREEVPYGNYTGQNIIGRLEGTTQADKTYIIDAHFDTVSNSPGADDNGSGVAGVLEILRVLAPYRFSKTLRFIGFDLEEEGLIGSEHYATNNISAEETIEGVFNMEMIGYYSDEPNSQTFPTGFNLLYPDQYAIIQADEFRGNFISNIGDQNAVALQTAYANAAALYVPDLKVISLTAPSNWLLITPDFGRSDHAPFWIAGIPALMLTDGSNFRNSNYHTVNDELETLNFTFMSQVVKAIVGAVAEEAGIEHSTTASADFSVTTGLDNTLDCKFQLSPVPVDEHLVLSFGRCDFEAVTVQIFDLTGKRVLEILTQPILTKTVDLDLTALEAGTYLLKASNGAQSISRKLIVN